MAISIDDFGCTDNTQQEYIVTVDDECINTIVTHYTSVVKDWIEEIEYIHRFRINRGKMVVGLDVEWRPQMQRNMPRNPVAVIQLCVGHRCLIFQVLRCGGVPLSLLEFLRNEDCTFVGVGIAGDVNKLWEDYELDVSNAVDLRFLAADETECRWMRNAGIAALSRAVLGKAIRKPRSVTMSDWSRARLTKEQVQYACVDAFLSFELGRVLRAYN
uniref:3'-5' exonuclease domain-containing protein n=1 Tax=Kalanchoe fedtschenkoi TaxID=63787 RepID=A0A7N0THU1_KALFE